MVNNRVSSSRVHNTKRDALFVSFARSYCPYGYLRVAQPSTGFVAFNGEWCGLVAGGYLLGNGHRLLNTQIMRFGSPDLLSPFGRGGINAYSFCSGDPINNTDPSGRFALSMIKPLKRLQHGVKAIPRIAASERLNFKSQQKTKVSVFSQYPKLSNRKLSKFGTEFEQFQEASADQGFKPIVINSKSDLKYVSGYHSRRFVLTDRGELLVDGSADLNRHGMNHAILATYGSKGGGVIAAGMIAAPKSGHVMLWNDSGHYHPNFSTLFPVEFKLTGMGVEVERIRVLASLG
ncbi:RHS repeat-associated core domain-containing protein [Pseudomonas sp. BR1R-5]|uniref:RHS repeat-associated core domain-containing protein n=1 Tax=unclassified Pseudomonas TaxID=196821 RepID=UPI0024904652